MKAFIIWTICGLMIVYSLVITNKYKVKQDIYPYHSRVYYDIMALVSTN